VENFLLISRTVQSLLKTYASDTGSCFSRGIGDGSVKLITVLHVVATSIILAALRLVPSTSVEWRRH